MVLVKLDKAVISQTVKEHQMVSKKLATLAGSVPAIHATPEAIYDDQTGAQVRVEHDRYERRILDFENAIRHERDRLRSEHLENMRAILGQEAAE
jgi:hypothetical protein